MNLVKYSVDFPAFLKNSAKVENGLKTLYDLIFHEANKQLRLSLAEKLTKEQVIRNYFTELSDEEVADVIHHLNNYVHIKNLR